MIPSQRGNYAMRAAGRDEIKRESFTRICNQVLDRYYNGQWNATLTLSGLISQHVNDVDFEVSLAFHAIAINWEHHC